MQKPISYRWSVPLLATLGIALAASAAAANRLAPVTMKAAPIVSITVGRSRLGAPIEVLTTTRAVSYTDLDLATRSGAATLRHRVHAAVWSVCQQLNEASAAALPGFFSCARKTEARAMRQVRLAVAVARALEKKA
jgi:UrcA family protein